MPQKRTKGRNGRKRKVVVIGGGTGTYQTLLGLKKYHYDISAIVTMADSGGSSGRLRESFKMLPPGDVRQALLALSCLPISQRTLEALFAYRFEVGDELKGHSVGNLILAALTQITGSEEEAIAQAEKLLACCGHVYPVTTDNTNLVAKLENGEEVFSEGKIDTRAEGKIPGSLSPIKRVYLKPQAKASTSAQKAIQKADIIILSAGDLYTSLIPNFLVKGIPEAIAKSHAKIVLVVNLMTKPGETDGYKASDFVRTVREYLGQAGEKLTYVIVNKGKLADTETLSRYKKEGQVPIENNLSAQAGLTGETNNLQIIHTNLVQTNQFVRHDPDKLARAIDKII